MCKSLEDKITLRLLLCTQESDSEDENYREWESVRLAFILSTNWQFLKVIFFFLRSQVVNFHQNSHNHH